MCSTVGALQRSAGRMTKIAATRRLRSSTMTYDSMYANFNSMSKLSELGRQARSIPSEDKFSSKPNIVTEKSTRIPVESIHRVDM